MATDWHDFWDRLPGNTASFTTTMLRPPMNTARFADGTPTTFLLFSKPPRVPVRAWTGKVTHIGHTGGLSRIVFRVVLRKEIRFPRRYAKVADGWYLVERGSSRTPPSLW